MHSFHISGKKSRRSFHTCTLLCLAVSLFLAAYPAYGQNNAASPAILEVVPSQFIVAEGTLLPLVNVTVYNVEALFAWQVKVYFDATMVNITKDRVRYAENHVFSNRGFVNVTPSVSSDTHGAYVLFGSSLLGGEEIFSGSGMLCQFNFSVLRSGVSTLNFSTPLSEGGTFLLDSDLNCILTKVVDNKSNGSLTLELDKTSFYIGELSHITISGVLSPKKTYAEVIIYYRSAESLWLKMASTVTDSEGSYSYPWKPSQAGTYTLVTEWYGDEKTNPAISAMKTVSVHARSPSVMPYLIMVLWAGVLIFAYIIIKKKTPEPSEI